MVFQDLDKFLGRFLDIGQIDAINQLLDQKYVGVVKLNRAKLPLLITMVITKIRVIQRMILMQKHADYARTITILRLEATAWWVHFIISLRRV